MEPGLNMYCYHRFFGSLVVMAENHPTLVCIRSSMKKASLPDVVFGKDNFKLNFLSYFKGWILSVHGKQEKSI